MSDSDTEDWLPGAGGHGDSDEGEAWPLRGLLIALLGLATGLCVHFLIGNDYLRTPTAMTLAQLAALTVTAGMIGFTIRRHAWLASLIFSLICGAAAGAVIYWNGNPDAWSGGDGWRAFSLVIALAIAAPLFQASLDGEEERFPYARVHDHVWANIVLWGACWVFVAITFALAWLLAALFQLVKIDFLSELLQKNWFWRALVGLAFGSALGVLRDHGNVVRLLQRVVALVLAVLAPVLAVGLVIFLLALPFTGLAPLWEAGSATAILLACVVGSFVLSNVVIGSAPDQERRFVVLRYGALALALVMLPLAIIAAVAIGLRIGQYGFTPERLWALTFVVVACAYGLAYLVSLLRGRLGWAEFARPANLHLSFALCAIALVLATPLVSFNAISTRDQVARLESGKIAPDKFDWRALAFQFGQPGRDALERLKTSPNAKIREMAVKAGSVTNRWDLPDTRQATYLAERRAKLIANLRVLPAGTSVSPQLVDELASAYDCNYSDRKCTLAFVSEGKEALLFVDGCFTPPPSPSPRPTATATAPSVSVRPTVDARVSNCGPSRRYVLINGKWDEPQGSSNASTSDAAVNGYREGRIEIRPVQRRQAFVGGVPVGEAFE